MAKYNRQQYQAAFEAADDAESGRLTGREATEHLVEDHGITQATAKDFVDCFRRIRRGLLYKRGLSEGATRQFLNGIESRHGVAALAIAVQAADSHMQYRKSLGVYLPGLLALIEEFRQRLRDVCLPLPDEEIRDKHVEGGRVMALVSKIERSSAARQKCIEHHGSICCVCGFSFGKEFGEIGFGFIHVHHLNPIGRAEGPREVDPILELRPICPNCHAMAHRVHCDDPPIPIDRLKAIRNASLTSAER